MQVPLPEGYRYEWLDRIDSTNTEALRRADAGEEPGLWICASEQSGGKGRLGRTWHSPPGNLYASVLLHPDAPLECLPQIGFVAGLAFYDAVNSILAPVAQTSLLLKWPNDLLWDGKKLGGLLVESADRSGSGNRAVVAGFGLNLSSHPEQTDMPASNLAQAGIKASPMEAFEALATCLSRWLDSWNSGQVFTGILDEWQARSMSKGTQIRVRSSDREIRGSFGGLDADGALLIEQANVVQRITAGDVFPV